MTRKPRKINGVARRAIAGSVITVATLGMLLVPASAATTTIGATADAFVVASSPTTNRGSWPGLRVLSGQKVSYLRFDVPALTGTTIARAKLRLYASTASRCAAGVQVLRAASDAWGERTITWANQPGSAGGVVASASWTGQGYRDFTVTTAVTPGAPVTFVVRHPETCQTSSDTVFASRESTTNRPQLIIETTATVEPACADGRDNDRDALVDLDDPGCTDEADTDETDGPRDEHVVAAAGDIACDPTYWAFSGTKAQCQHRSTAGLLVSADVVLTLGDLQYESGTLQKFMDSYDPSWGQASARTYPAVGNHEYQVAGARGYLEYWTSKGRPTGIDGGAYYSYDVGTWHLVALNSNCAVVPCGEGTPQNDWLEQDLAGSTKPCVAAYWHHPYFNSGAHHGAEMPAGAKAFWDDLFVARADLILNGHEHNYQRYGKQDPTGVPDPNGIRAFIVGSGGRSHYGMLDVKDPNYQFGNTTDFGVLRLYLGPNSYRWEFVAINGVVLDAGGPVACN